MLRISDKLFRAISMLAVVVLTAVCLPIQFTNWANAGESISLTTISGTTDPSYVSGVAELGYIATSNSDYYRMDFVLKVSPSGSAVNLQLLNSSAKNANLKIVSSTSALVIPNISEAQPVSAYVKIQVCDLKNGCAGQISVLGTYVVTVIATSVDGISKSADIILKVETPTPTPTPTPTAGDSACRENISSALNKLTPVSNNFNSWITLWSDYKSLSEFFTKEGLDLTGAYNYYMSAIDEQQLVFNSVLKPLMGAKDVCGSTSIYREWSNAYIKYGEIGQAIEKTRISISNLFQTWQSKYPPIQIPTTVIVDAPNSINLDADGFAKFTIVAWAEPLDKKQLPKGRFNLAEDIVYKGGCGYMNGQNIGIKESVSTIKPGSTYLVLEFNLKITGSCSGQIRYYGNSSFARSDGLFNININPKIDTSKISISQVSLYDQYVAPGGVATIYYWINKPMYQSNSGLGAGIGEYGVDPGPFGEEFSSIGWTLGFVKGISEENGLYKSNIQIPINAKPGVYKTWVFWKGITGPVYGPDITITSPDLVKEDAIKNFGVWVQDAKNYFSNLVMEYIVKTFGNGGYKYINLRPEPLDSYYQYPTIEKFGLYKAILKNWADFEISNLKIENFTKSTDNLPSKAELQKQCEIQASAATKSLKENDILLSQISQRINNLASVDLALREKEINNLREQIKSIDQNLSIWAEKLPYYLKNNSDCTIYSTLSQYTGNLFSVSKSIQVQLNKLNTNPTPKDTYINLVFVGDNKNLNGEELFLDGIDAASFGRGSIEVNAFVRSYDSKLMYGSQSLNYEVLGKVLTPSICKISSPKYFLGSDNPFTKFSVAPIAEGKCSIGFSSTINNRSDLKSTSNTWTSTVRVTVSSSSSYAPIEINDNGIEVEPTADLSFNKKNDGSYAIKVDTNLESENIEIFATKKGSKTIKFTKNTGQSTQFVLNTTRNLKGYTLTVKFEGNVISRIVVSK